MLYGSSNRELDFYLFIQGTTQGQRLDLKQKVLISGATKGDGSALEKAWALHNAQVYYERFMRDGDVQHLQLARQLLEPYHMPLAFY